MEFQNNGNGINPDVVELIIEIITDHTKLPTIVLSNNHNFPEKLEKSCDSFTEFCQKLHSYGYFPKCMEDHRQRANVCKKATKQFCWMGLRNFVYPIIVNEKKQATVLYGQCRSNNEYYSKIEQKIFNNNLSSLDLTDDQKIELKYLFSKLDRVDDSTYLLNGEGELSKILRWFGSAVSELQRIESAIFRVNHELSNYTTGVYSAAYEFYSVIDRNDEILGPKCKELLASLKRLRTVIENFGPFLGSYTKINCDLKRMLEIAVDTYSAVAEARYIKIRIYTTDNSIFPVIVASKKHLEIVFNNLIANAVKYSFRGNQQDYNYRRTVDIMGCMSEEGYKIRIQNYGIGILKEEIDSGKIFEAGYQGKLTIDEYRDGGGYGLSITKEILDNHNIKFSLDSQKSMGDGFVTTATLTFAQNNGE